MDRDDVDETAPGKIVPTTSSKGTYSAFRPDPLPPSISTAELITVDSPLQTVRREDDECTFSKEGDITCPL